jgi:hypothetical protein
MGAILCHKEKEQNITLNYQPEAAADNANKNNYRWP